VKLLTLSVDRHISIKENIHLK